MKYKHTFILLIFCTLGDSVFAHRLNNKLLDELGLVIVYRFLQLYLSIFPTRYPEEYQIMRR